MRIVNLPVDILADVANLDSCEMVGCDNFLSDVLQDRASVNGRIDLIYGLLSTSKRLRDLSLCTQSIVVTRSYSNARSAESTTS